MQVRGTGRVAEVGAMGWDNGAARYGFDGDMAYKLVMLEVWQYTAIYVDFTSIKYVKYMSILRGGPDIRQLYVLRGTTIVDFFTAILK